MKNISKTNEVKVHFKTDAFLCIPFNHQLYCGLSACYISLFLKFSSLIAAAEIVSHSVSAINNRRQARSKSVHAVYYFSADSRGSLL